MGKGIAWGCEEPVMHGARVRELERENAWLRAALRDAGWTAYGIAHYLLLPECPTDPDPRPPDDRSMWPAWAAAHDDPDAEPPEAAAGFPECMKGGY